MPAAPRRPPPIPAPRRAPPRRRRWAWLGVLIGLLATLAIGAYVGLVVVRRVETGRWEMPDPADVVTIVRPAKPRGPSRVIFLEGAPVTLSPGDDDASRGLSSVLRANHPDGPVTLPGWKGSKASWKKLVTCVRKLFAPFDVEVTDQRPTTDDFILVAVGGKPADIGVEQKRITGLAPFNGGIIPRAVVFGFAGAMSHKVTTTCETIGMEVAHAYGLDHEYLCKDVMTYLAPCGAKSFVDKDVACGEGKKRACEGGAATQNSYRRLLDALGPAPPPPAKPKATTPAKR
ncbi:MAG: hypothetical protein H6709_09305 [Kofleriaceae bacterium]|nr:hypothetical protein [Kofleriaceae bacterium]MCB9572268.1 hypothetical protein [Kofleriaceae bacterium]